jgi:hypothetical protein
MYNLQAIEDELLIISKWLIKDEDKNIFIRIYRIYKLYLFENKLKCFHLAINKLIIDGKSKNLYIYCLFDGVLTKNMVEEEDIWL